MKKIIIGLVAVGLSLSMAASAQMNGQKVQIHEPSTGLQEGVEPQQLKVGVQAGQAGQAGKQIAYPSLATSSNAVKAAVKNMQIERDAFMERVEANREAAVANRAQVKEELKTKLQNIQNEAKKKAVERLDENFVKINANFVEKWTDAVSRIDASLAKIVSAVNESATSTSTSPDLTMINTMIGEANLDIASAKAAIEDQAQKAYAVTVTTEENLKMDVFSVRDLLNTDLKSVREMIKAAHASVVDVLVEYNKIK